MAGNGPDSVPGPGTDPSISPGTDPSLCPRTGNGSEPFSGCNPSQAEQEIYGEQYKVMHIFLLMNDIDILYISCKRTYHLNILFSEG